MKSVRNQIWQNLNLFSVNLNAQRIRDLAEWHVEYERANLIAKSEHEYWIFVDGTYRSQVLMVIDADIEIA